MKYQIHFDNGKKLNWESTINEQGIKQLLLDKHVVILSVGIVDFSKVSYITKVGKQK